MAAGGKSNDVVRTYRQMAAAIWVNERISGLGSALAHATTRLLGGMSTNGTVTRPSGSAWPSGATPTLPFQSTA